MLEFSVLRPQRQVDLWGLLASCSLLSKCHANEKACLTNQGGWCLENDLWPLVYMCVRTCTHTWTHTHTLISTHTEEREGKGEYWDVRKTAWKLPSLFLSHLMWELNEMLYIHQAGLGLSIEKSSIRLAERYPDACKARGSIPTAPPPPPPHTQRITNW